MAFIFIGLAIYVLPILVFHYTINKYDNELDGMPFTAQELGQEILNDFEIKNVDIEPTEMGDHYDPDRKKIRINYGKDCLSCTDDYCSIDYNA